MTDHALMADEGFVRVPRAWLHLSISPQAKTLLIAFCDFADDTGESWCSYEYLSGIVHRSKAAICGYVGELRDAGLIHTTTQTYANGYNYRLKVRLIGWSGFLSSWARLTLKKRELARQSRDNEIAADVATAKMPAETTADFVDQNIECGIQDSERKDPKGPINEIHQNKTHRLTAMSEWCKEDEMQWWKFRSSDNDPITIGTGTPDRALLEKAIQAGHLAQAELGLLSGPALRDHCESALKAFVERHDLEPNEHALKDCVDTLASLAATPHAVNAAMVELDKSWKPYWKRLSTPKQFAETVRGAARTAGPSSADRERAQRFMGRARVAEFWLRKLEREHDRKLPRHGE